MSEQRPASTIRAKDDAREALLDCKQFVLIWEGEGGDWGTIMAAKASPELIGVLFKMNTFLAVSQMPRLNKDFTDYTDPPQEDQG